MPRAAPTAIALRSETPRRERYRLSQARIDGADIERGVDKVIVPPARRVAAARTGIADDLVDVSIRNAHTRRREGLAQPRHGVLTAALEKQAPSRAAKQPGHPFGDLEILNRIRGTDEVPDTDHQRLGDTPLAGRFPGAIIVAGCDRSRERRGGRPRAVQALI